jgi:riboflavin biosynthesis pyrimidine reductase
VSPEPRIDALWPTASAALSDDELIAGFAHAGSWLSANFVSSIDGAATHDGRSAALGGAADRRVFDLLRRPCDVVLVGAGTVRVEGYGAMRLDAASVAWRLGAGLPEHPVLAIVSAALDLDPASGPFAAAPVRPIVITIGTSSPDRRAALSAVAEVIVCGDTALDAPLMVAELARRGLRRIHSEGGPTLFGTLLTADVVDELSITVSPLLEGGPAPRIVAGGLPHDRRMRLASVLASGDTLLLRYERDRSAPDL